MKDKYIKLLRQKGGFIFQGAGRLFDRVKFSVKKRRSLLTALALAFLLSDILILESHKFLLPGQTPPAPKLFTKATDSPSENYDMIWKKNIFHPGPIPSSPTAGAPSFAEPIKTSLPFVLQGTIVHADPRRSVATVKTLKESLPYKVGDRIGKQARMIEIQRKRIIFLNESSNALEFLELPETHPVTLSFKRPSRRNSIKAGLAQRDGNTFTVKRSHINEYLQRLPKILQQARMIPNRVVKDGESVIEGFRFVSIDKTASWLKDLGFQEGDVIKQVDGEMVNNPETAVMLFEKLRDSNGFEMLVERDGQETKRSYKVNWDTAP